MNTRHQLLRTLTALITLLMMGLIAHAQQPAFLTNGLVAYYPFNGDANDFVGADNGTVLGAILTQDRFGSRNSAYSFDSSISSAITTSGKSFPFSNSPVSVTCWFKAKTPISKAGVMWSVGDTSLSLGVVEGYMEALLNYINPSTSALEVGFVHTASLLYYTTLADNKWHSYAISVESNGLFRAYLDGERIVFQTSVPPGMVINITRGPFFIGYGAGTYFDGDLDDLRIYNRALSADEVSALYKYERNPPLRPATATLQLANGFVIGASITDGGVGYTNVPNVTIIGSGSGASAIASVANGVVTGVTIISAGHGYDSKATISIDPPPFPPSQATANATIANGKVSTITVSDGGHGYGTTIPPVSIIGGGGVGAKAVANVVNGSVVSVTITSSGTAYSSVPTVLIAAPPSSPTVSLVVKQVELDMNLVVGYSYKIQTSYDGGNTWSDTASAFLATDSLMTKVFTVTSTAQLFRVVQVN